VLLFAAAGVFDLFWHTYFGIENGIDALLSPSHLLLALGAALVFSGVLRSIARQYGRETGGWRKIGPAVLALGAALVLLGFFTAYAQPIEDGFTTTTIGRDPSGPLAAQLYESNPSGGAAQRLSLPPGLDIWGVAVAPDGNHIAYRAQAPHSAASSATEPSDLYVANADGSQARRITHSGRHDTQVAWSPDSTSLAYISMPAGTSGDFELRVVRDDGSAARTLVAGTTTLATPAWSRDGRIAYASRNGLDGMLAVVPATGGAPRWLANTKGGSAPAWSGGDLFFTTDDGALHRASPSDGPAATVVQKGASEASVSFDGRYLVYLGNAAGAVQNTGGSAWTADMLLGSPLLAGCAGLLVGFCYRPPLPEAAEA
jgi:hypothetical protein